MDGGRNTIVVAGCGASGMMAAISAARSGAQVTVLEAAEKPGKKLLLTGNGRCNLTHLPGEGAVLSSLYHSALPEHAKVLTKKVLDQLSVPETLSLFHSLGLPTATEQADYVYPASGQARSVLAVLLREMDRLKIKRKYAEAVTDIRPQKAGGWEVLTGGWRYPCDKVILSCGSLAGGLKNTEDGYGLLRSLGLRTTKLLPALCAMSCTLPGDRRSERCDQLLSSCAGARMRAQVTAFADGTRIAQETGQLQWSAAGISGIVVFNIASAVTRALDGGAAIRLELDLLPGSAQAELTGLLLDLQTTYPKSSTRDLLSGMLPDRVIPLIAELGGEDASAIAHIIKQFSLEGKALKALPEAQVCAGGAAIDQVDPHTLECTNSALHGIYLTGELLDIDGPCGGYNLQWAWSSGYVAGKWAAKVQEGQ